MTLRHLLDQQIKIVFSYFFVLWPFHRKSRKMGMTGEREHVTSGWMRGKYAAVLELMLFRPFFCGYPFAFVTFNSFSFPGLQQFLCMY